MIEQYIFITLQPYLSSASLEMTREYTQKFMN